MIDRCPNCGEPVDYREWRSKAYEILHRYGIGDVEAAVLINEMVVVGPHGDWTPIIQRAEHGATG